jgi:hypothetical protein
MRTDTADRVVLSYPADIGKHGRKRLHQDYYRGWLRKSHDAVAVGDEWDEFTSRLCPRTVDSARRRVRA